MLGVFESIIILPVEDNFILPFTSNFSPGELVPMPTFIELFPIIHVLDTSEFAPYPIQIVLSKSP